MKPAGIFVDPLTKLASRMKIGQNQLDCGNLELGMEIDRNAAPVVANGERAIAMDRHVDLGAMACKMLVDRVVENLKNAMVQPALIGMADVHAGTLAHRIQAFQLIDF
jgi:hypothetical protein